MIKAVGKGDERMIERMDDFFTARVEGYDGHMRTYVEGDSAFYEYTAALLPGAEGVSVLDLGCGTGLELEAYFKVNPQAKVTGIDLTEAMLNVLRGKFPEKEMTLIQGSYFDVPLGEETYDAAVSVESLHHFTAEKKLSLYKKLHAALKKQGTFVLTDYFAESEEEEKEYFQELKRIKQEQGIADDEFYHYDTPLTVAHEMAALRKAGFSEVRLEKEWGSTCTVVAVK